MTILAFPPVVPDGDYRIRSTDRSNPDLYLEWQSDNEVKPMPLKQDSDLQKWKITAQNDDMYIINNLASKTELSIMKYTENGQEKARLFAGTRQYWNLDPRGDDFIIAPIESELCVDLATNNWVILWPRRNARNQRWILDSVVPSAPTSTSTTGTGTNTNTSTGVAPTGTTAGTGSSASAKITSGIYNIRNRSSSGQLCIWTGFQYDNAPALVWPYAPTSRYDTARAWTVTPQKDGVTLTNSLNATLGARCLKEGPYVNVVTNVCRLIPVSGTQFFHIATSTAADSRVVMDSNPFGTANLPTTMSEYNADEPRQHWEFIPAP